MEQARNSASTALIAQLLDDGVTTLVTLGFDTLKHVRPLDYELFAKDLEAYCGLELHTTIPIIAEDELVVFLLFRNEMPVEYVREVAGEMIRARVRLCKYRVNPFDRLLCDWDVKSTETPGVLEYIVRAQELAEAVDNDPGDEVLH